MESGKLLNISQLHASYGLVKALRGVELSLEKGDIVSLLGRNGMGKSTIVKCICGILTPTHGTITLNGLNIVGTPSHKIGKMGIGLVPEGRRIFSNLNVSENLLSAARKGYWDLPKIITLFPIFKSKLKQKASTLSGGEQQMLSIGRALMTNPIMLILDEATEGLSPLVTKQVWKVLNTISKEGMSILIIDKLSNHLTNFSNAAYVIERGKTVWHGSMDKLSTQVKKKYLAV